MMELDKGRKLLVFVGLIGFVVVTLGILFTALGVEHWNLTAWIFLLCLVNTVLCVGLYLQRLFVDSFEVVE